MRLARSRGQQVVAADDLPHSLRGVVDDDGEVVGPGAVAAAEHEVVDDVGALAVEPVATVTSARSARSRSAKSSPASARRCDSASLSVRQVPG